MSKDKISESSEEVDNKKGDDPPKKTSSAKRITVQFSQEMYEDLQWLADQQGGISLAEAVRKAVGLESYLRQQLTKKGTRLIIDDPDLDYVREIVIR